ARDRVVVARRQLGAQFAQAAVELAALAAHALERLHERGGLGAPGFERQRQRVRGLARLARGGAGGVAGLDQAAALVLQRLPGGSELGHARDRILELRPRLARLLAAAGGGRGQLLELGVDAFDAVARRLQPALLALQLAGQLGHAAVGQVQPALRVLALLLGGEQAVAPGADAALEFVLALLQFLDLRAQRLDLALAQQRALLGRARAQHPYPAGAQALTVAGDDRMIGIPVRVQPRLQGARLVEGFGHVQATQQAPDRQRPAHLRRQRGGRETGVVAVVIGMRGRHQRQPALAQFAQRHDQRLGAVDQHAFDQQAERAFDRGLPAGVHLQPPAHARGRIQAALAQPFDRRTLLLAERGVLQGFQRRQPAALFLRLLAHLGQLALRGALLVLQLGDRLLALFEVGVERVERGLLLLVPRLDAGE